MPHSLISKIKLQSKKNETRQSTKARPKSSWPWQNWGVRNARRPVLPLAHPHPASAPFRLLTVLVVNWRKLIRILWFLGHAACKSLAWHVRSLVMWTNEKVSLHSELHSLDAPQKHSGMPSGGSTKAQTLRGWLPGTARWKVRLGIPLTSLLI